ncbi:hypothetical protein BH11BAC4_BH11BAC4_10620 [soil metagenome]
MEKKHTIYQIMISCFLLLLLSCNTKESSTVTEEDASTVITPVTTVGISSGPMATFVELNATSVFQQKWIIKSTVTGYLQQSNIQLNKFVGTGQVLFTVKTKEASSIGNTISMLDSSFKFSGVNSIRSNGTGFISEMNHQAGDYVQDGEQLAVVTDTKSFVFLLDLPYEMRPYIAGKSAVQLLLPDGEKLEAFITGNMPVMDSAAQTQRILLKVNATHPIPENLIAKVRLVKAENNRAYYLPKAAVLADEAQSGFWIMKMINDSTAVKVAIKKGIENDDAIEIVSPVFSGEDKILLTGNFGLPDTARVKTVSSSTANP